MNTERLRQIERLYLEAAALDESARDSFLGEACGSDESLRKEVETLLAQEHKAKVFLESTALQNYRFLLQIVGLRFLLMRFPAFSDVIKFWSGLAQAEWEWCTRRTIRILAASSR
jgi:hypothetical protein